LGEYVYPPERGPGIPPPTPSGRETRNARYAYLVGRLHNRQITMEEATELFTIMQSMIQTSEAARAALMRTQVAPSAPIPPPPGPPPQLAVGGGDELLLVGLFAIGAGAGLLAAMTKRIQDATPSSGSSAGPSAGSQAATRTG